MIGGRKALGTLPAKNGAIDETALPKRRGAERASVHIEAKITSSCGETATMMIDNVSTHGCNIGGVTDWLRIGSFVGVGLAQEQPLQAIVRWVRDGSAGLEFMRPVPRDNATWHELINSI